MIAIQADEHSPQEVVTGLNARGIETHSAYREGLSGASDREVYRVRAAEESRSPDQ
jgi:hypothetical protein